MTGPAILIVDDVENNREALAMRLDLAGYGNVTQAADGRSALALMREHAFELVLLDIMMPEMDGFQVLEEMKSDTELRETPVIVISAVGEIDSVVRCIELGATDYLVKPFNPTLLKAKIDNYVEKAQYKAEKSAYLRQLEAEKKRSDQLLATLLPKQMARILKANHELPPVRYNDVTVLFCDVVDFTAYSEGRAPETVFAHLETLFQDFEHLIGTHGLVKIKTIGDAFMATAGLLEGPDEPVRAAVDCALDMVTAAGRHPEEWQVRAGIDHGAVVAGVIGRTHFQFDVWGDTVNTAARIQSIGTPGTVSLSGRAWQQLHGHMRGRSLGFVDLKGKEPIEVIECQGSR